MDIDTNTNINTNANTNIKYQISIIQITISIKYSIPLYYIVLYCTLISFHLISFNFNDSINNFISICFIIVVFYYLPNLNKLSNIYFPIFYSCFYYFYLFLQSIFVDVTYYLPICAYVKYIEPSSHLPDA